MNRSIPLIVYVITLLVLPGFIYSQAVSSFPAVINPGGTITVSFSGAPGNKTDWIGLYPESAPSDRSWLTWKYTEGNRNGTLTFNAPDKPGRYNFRMFENDGYKLLATGNTFIVQVTPPPVSGKPAVTCPDFANPGGVITVTFSGAPGNKTDWIAIYPESAPSDRSWLTWKYTEGNRNGTLTFNVPDKPGRYNFRMFENDGYKLLATGNTFIVGVVAPPQPPAGEPFVSNPDNAKPGEIITVTFSGAPGNKTDWIGLYPETAPSDRSWLTWKYTEGNRNGTLTFNAPDKPGRYNFRMFENDGYKLLSTGNTIIVR